MSDEQRLVAGRYRLLAPVGAGGMGTVWRAEDVVLGREVAVKEVLFPRGLSDEDREVLRERTRREARAAARLDHPSAVTVYDVVEEGGSPYLVMELVEARTLSQVVREDGPLTPQRTAQVGLALLGALDMAHRQGIVHRDVKPGNVLLRADGRVVLTDFGIASSPGDSSITSTGLLLGSPSYIAPERARGLPPGPASDLWSLGATLFTAVEGRPPFDGGEPLLTVTAVVTGEHEPFVAAGPLAPVLEGLLTRDPEHRTDAAAARAALEPIAASSRVAAPPEPSPEAEERSEETTALDMGEVREQVAAADASPAAQTLMTPVLRDDRPRPAPRSEPTWSQPPVLHERPRRRSRAPLLALLAVLVLGAGVAGYALTEGRDTPTTASPSPGASPATDERGPSPAPEGWTTVEEGGVSFAVPPSHTRSIRNGLVQYRDEAERRTLRLYAAEPAEGDALTTARARGNGFSQNLASYQEVAVGPADGPGLDAADLDFTWTDERAGADLHVLDRTFVSEDGSRRASLYWQVGESGYPASLEVFEQIAQTFRFTG